MIPEFIGRLPIIATLNELDKKCISKNISRTKNSLVKQYQKLFEIDGVELTFEEEALKAIVDKAIERKNRSKRTSFNYRRNNERYNVRNTI